MIGLFSKAWRMKSLGIGLAFLSAFFVFQQTSVEAQTAAYPTRSITIVNSWAAGNSIDLNTRAITPRLSEMWGVPIDVVSKPGGSGIVGSNDVMRAKPDGYTILAEGSGNSPMQLGMDLNLPYKVMDRTFLARTFQLPFGMVVSVQSPWKTLGDIEQVIRKNPSGIRVGNLGSGTAELPMAQFKAALAARGVDTSQLKVVPFQGTLQVITAVAGGHVDFYPSSFLSAKALVAAGKLRMIAVFSKERSKFMPEVQTTVEQGYPSVLTTEMTGYAGPAGMPDYIVQKWISALKMIVNDPAMVADFDKLWVTPAFLGGDDYKNFVVDYANEIRKHMGKGKSN